MKLAEILLERSPNPDATILVSNGSSFCLRDILESQLKSATIKTGDVVALVGDFDPLTLAAFLMLVDRGAVIMPLAEASSAQHEYFFSAGKATVVYKNGDFTRLKDVLPDDSSLVQLRENGIPGLILFSSGTTGQPKAILHDFSRFIARYSTPRKAFKTLNFLLFDHIGGLNTLFHTMFNGGTVIRPVARTPEAVVKTIRDYGIELLPATPTFLRMLMMSGLLETEHLPDLKLITYGTERMDQHTLSALCNALPEIDFRQTYGMSELGIMRARTRKRDELWVEIGGEGVESKIVAGELFLRSAHCMLGYLNAPSPFDDEGWYATKDLVETDGNWLRFVGRKDDLVNVGGLKVLPSVVEHAALTYPGMLFARAKGSVNPLTGMHVELLCNLEPGIKPDKGQILQHLRERLPAHAVPRRITFGNATISHRCKQL